MRFHQTVYPKGACVCVGARECATHIIIEFRQRDLGGDRCAEIQV